jgi:RNA polymerase sigma factor (TIGR02999 family)
VVVVMTRSTGPVTQLLAAVGRGDGGASEKLWALIYEELRAVARHQLAGEDSAGTLQPTALVHEAFLRLTGGGGVQWANRRHFFAAAAKAMHRIRIDDARRRKRLKRGGGRRPGVLGEGPAIFDQDPDEVLAIDEALGRLKQEEPRAAEVVLLRYFAGLTVNETAEALGVSGRTVKSDWQFARTWLHRELRGD